MHLNLAKYGKIHGLFSMEDFNMEMVHAELGLSLGVFSGENRCCKTKTEVDEAG
jgi:hypothetical protein